MCHTFCHGRDNRNILVWISCVQDRAVYVKQLQPSCKSLEGPQKAEKDAQGGPEGHQDQQRSQNWFET